MQTKPDAQVTQAAISTVYALLNEITRYTSAESGSADKMSFNGSAIAGAPALEQLNEKQKQQVCANVLSAIVGVAVYLKDDNVSTCITQLIVDLIPYTTSRLFLKLSLCFLFVARLYHLQQLLH